MKNFFSIFNKPVAIEPLVVFRVIFGAMMVFSTARFITLGWIEDHFVTPLFHFKYYGFSWVEVLSPEGMYALHFIMLAAALGVMLGFYYRISALLLFITFSYTELIDLTYYLNHYYFVSIICGLLILVPANRSFSLDVLRNPALQLVSVPHWTILIFKLQLTIVYTYAGIAKINRDWLIEALPLKIWMPANDNLPFIGWLLVLPLMPYVFSWLGMIYDCTIVFWLSNKRTRAIAYLSVMFFHTVTGMMFQIGVFPLVMIGATLIFFSEDWHKKMIAACRGFFPRRIFKQRSADAALSAKWPIRTLFSPLIKGILIVHFGFQIIFPWRYILYPGNTFWTEQGYRFSWRVMLMEKAGTATFYVKDTKTGREGVVDNLEFLNAHQEKQMAMQPDMVLQFAHFLKDWYAQQGVIKPEVRAEVYVTLNARPSQLLVDPTVNLTTMNDDWSNKKWIMPYR